MSFFLVCDISSDLVLLCSNNYVFSLLNGDSQCIDYEMKHSTMKNKHINCTKKQFFNSVIILTHRTQRVKTTFTSHIVTFVAKNGQNSWKTQVKIENPKKNNKTQ